MIRDNNIGDIQTILYELFASLTTTLPWSNWSVVYGFPNTEIIEAQNKVFMYIEEPILSGESVEQMAGQKLNSWIVQVGFWVNLDMGDRGEAQEWLSELINLVQNKYNLYKKEFNVEIGGVEYSDTTLKAQGIMLKSISSVRTIPTDENDDYRLEVQLHLTA